MAKVAYRRVQRILGNEFQYDTSFMVLYLGISQHPTYGSLVHHWIMEDLRWREEMPPDVESFLLSELRKRRGL